MGQLIVILGGVRSGKSSFAQALAQGLAEDDVVYLATGEAGDEEMAHRIEQHQLIRPNSWRTTESQRMPGNAIAELDPEPEVVLLDCLTLWISNILLDAGEATPLPEIERQMLEEIENLLTAVGASGITLIVVSGEVGLGVVPDSLLGRQFRDLHGWANQRLLDSADRTYFMVAGRPVPLDSIATTIDECVKEYER